MSLKRILNYDDEDGAYGQDSRNIRRRAEDENYE